MPLSLSLKIHRKVTLVNVSSCRLIAKAFKSDPCRLYASLGCVLAASIAQVTVVLIVDHSSETTYELVRVKMRVRVLYCCFSTLLSSDSRNKQPAGWLDCSSSRKCRLCPMGKHCKKKNCALLLGTLFNKINACCAQRTK